MTYSYQVTYMHEATFKAIMVLMKLDICHRNEIGSMGCTVVWDDTTTLEFKLRDKEA